MKVSELISILNSYDKNADIIIYDDFSDSSYEINCIDIDENDTSNSNSTVVILV
ncbi:MAG: hypothetical protein HFI21_09245 [Lachnospiraceae bacterium]|nr:hypothetical protein [Lachnospiraceae bacterium]MCI9624418.1 hypothetical protein [Lachnospiraceae bacterium]